MHVVFVLGSYSPNYSANGLCCKHLIDEFISRGIDVTCIASKYGDHTQTETIDGAVVIRVRPRLYQRALWFCERRRHLPAISALKQIVIFVNRIKLFLTSFRWPLISPRYCSRLSAAIMNLHSEKCIDVMVAVNKPIESLLAGSAFKKENPEALFVPYYLDALAGGWGPAIWDRKKIENRTRKYEKQIDAFADLIISLESSKKYHMSNPMGGEIDSKRVYLDIPMILGSCESSGLLIPPHKKPYMLFAGAIHYPIRNPKPLLDALVSVCIERDIDVLFAGSCNRPDVILAYNNEAKGHFFYLGQLEHDQVIELENNALCLLNIGSTNPNTIPCKIFEYINCAKPIISTYSIEEEPSIPYLLKYEHSYLLDENRDDFDSQSKEICDFLDESSRISVSPEAIKTSFKGNLPSAFVDKVLDYRKESKRQTAAF